MDSTIVPKSSSSPGRLIVFCDGTWCGPEHGTRTNIQLLAEMTGIDVESVKGPREITDLSRQLRAKYFNGIACNYLSYGMGGPADNIERLCLDIYRYVAQWYKQETEIWLFGLGRGAYALRCVVGMINNCGIVKDPNDDLCNLVYRTYLSPCKNDKPSSAQSKDFRRRASWDVVTPIKLMVLLDTLGTIDPDTTGYATKSPTLRDEVIPSTVDKVLHACSIHDRFSPFQPCLATKAEHKASPEVHEVWFPGCHYDIGRQHCQFFSRSWLYCIPSMLTGNVEPNHVLSNVVICWVLRFIAREFRSQGVFQDLHWQISFLKKSIRTASTRTGSGDAYGSARTLQYAPFGRVLSRLPLVSRIADKASLIMPLRDRRISDGAANVMRFDMPNQPGDEKSLANLAKIDTQRYPSRTYEDWKTWKNYTANAEEKKAILWVGSAISNPKNGTIPLRLEPAPTRSLDSLKSFASSSNGADDHASIASVLSKHDKARHQRSSSSMSQDITLDAANDPLIKSIISQDEDSVRDQLEIQASELAFDFEWLGELIEMGYAVEDIADALIQEESESPWLIVSGGNFSKRMLKIAGRLERKRKPGEPN
ncbi:hypothetical protein D6C84_02935 [Aureobasidium pullulans]|uniref:T6SS Phospholipase effector Tle1-like catalytic domain-containing protein n=1 Tax=Aureobasidium pullulans TaxID=5580 RepID=A0A4S9Y0R9_AURPU|nr:hypothetical protein D6C84_02935 [Aureobasidium pullulans]